MGHACTTLFVLSCVLHTDVIKRYTLNIHNYYFDPRLGQNIMSVSCTIPQNLVLVCRLFNFSSLSGAISTLRLKKCCWFPLTRATLFFVPTLNSFFLVFVDDFRAKIWLYVRERYVSRFNLLIVSIHLHNVIIIPHEYVLLLLTFDAMFSHV